MAQTLVTNRYVPPGTYIGQIIKPNPTNLDADARVPAYVGRGHRLALGENLGIRRSFVFAEQLAFPISAPFLAQLQYAADGTKDAPVRLFKQDGTEVRADQWQFVAVSGEWKQVYINTEAFDATATYKMDYQSTDRSVLDPIPVADIRLIKDVGLQEGQPEYQELSDFLVVTNVTSPVGASTNTNLVSDQGTIIPYISLGSGSVSFVGSSAYNYLYNRAYEVVCTNIVGTSPNRQATFAWSADARSAGNNAAPSVPLTPTGIKPSFIVDETSGTYDFDLEYGLKLHFDFGLTNFALGDTYRFDAVGPSLVELDGRLINTNQFVEYLPILKYPAAPASTGVVTLNDQSAFTGTYNTKYTLKVDAATGTAPNRLATITWSESGETFINGSFIIDEANYASQSQLLSKGIRLDFGFGATHFVVNDVFDMQVLAPRMVYTGKDTRDMQLDITNVVNANANEGTIAGTYLSSTPEGGFGLFTALSAYDRSTVGLIELPNNMKLMARNMFKKWSVGSQFVLSDRFTYSALNQEKLDWSLNKHVSQEFEATEILNDVLGTVTGVVNSYYIVLQYVPIAGTVVVKDAVTGSIFSSTEVPGSAFVFFLTNPNVRLLVSYTHKGAEPDPGQLYYFTGYFVRPVELYDTPQLILQRVDGRTLLAPASSSNHLHIMNEIAWDNNTPAAYFVQVRDIDSDGVFTNLDYRRALLATEHVSRVTDRIVLSNFASLSDQLAVNLRANDPFEKRESLDWFGAPIGTPIGDVDTINSLVFLARKTLQVYGSSPSHGTRILHAATWCKRTIELEDNLTQQVTLDGSFVAGALAALNASFTDPSTTILRKTLAGFDSIQVYTEPENIILGSNQLVYFSDQGSSVYRIEEDVTVDSYAEEFQLISAMNQKEAVTKVVRREMDSALISIVVPSGEAGVNLVKATLSGILVGLLSRGVIADYQDASGNVRKFDPAADVIVFRDSTSATRYNFLYAYYLKFPIKRLFGLYQTGSNQF